nr:immunoglobulin light chain junction region [Macaca mulatta]
CQQYTYLPPLTF